FWSGPTPMYAPPLTPADISAGITSRYERSFEIRLSVSNAPSGSESRSIWAANFVSARAGSRPWSAQGRRLSAQRTIAARRGAGYMLPVWGRQAGRSSGYETEGSSPWAHSADVCPPRRSARERLVQLTAARQLRDDAVMPA